ncbi:DddA-like double-stranded DNA deaminase toxin [Streptomyces albidoflavus]
MPSPFRRRPRTSGLPLTLRRATLLGLGVALSVGLLPQFAPLAEAEEKPSGRPGTQTALDAPVAGKHQLAKKPPADRAAKSAMREAELSSWPKAARVETAVGAEPTRVAGTPLTVGRSGSAGPADVRLSVLGRGPAERLGVDGALMAVERTDGQQDAGPVEVTFDYEDFADRFGGEYGSRLRMVSLPACALTTPEKEKCATPRPLESTNDPAARTLTAEVVAPATGAQVFAAVAGDSGSQGDFAATSLKASSQWSVSNSSGAFNWSYPLSVPPVPGGLIPGISFSYNSQSVDGQTAATNNQGSWVGQGFGYEPGFIERRYKACADDGQKETYGDQCWGHQNATISLPGGASGELVLDDKTDEWRVASDDFSKIELLDGATNGDNDGEHWKLTATDGTQYFFGLNRLPGYESGDTATESAWTVPVYGDDANEPCHASTFETSHCKQAWRWNLDYVVDPRGSAMAYYYGTETNYYTQGLKTGENGKAYHRGGYLKRAEYGLRDQKAYDVPAAARVVFDTAERCIGDLTDCSPGALKDDTAADWPDVPWDRNCKAETQCKGQNSPTFWTRKKLTAVTTQIRSGTTGYQDVDTWKFGHLLTDNGDGSKSLWLNTIDHSGKAGTTVELPSVKLYGTQLPNRVDKQRDNIQAFHRFRLSGVESEAGSMLSVNYAGRECAAGDLPAEGKSTVRCYPVKWNPPGEEEPITDWFHKYAVSSVIEQDLVGGSPDQVTSYQYLGDAGWRKNRSDGLTESKYLTWGDWRGYERVRVTTSDGTNHPSNGITEHVFFRGLDGDSQPGGGTRESKVTDALGVTHTDSDWKSGLELQTTQYDGDEVVTRSVTTPWTKVTATREESWGTRHARFTREKRTDTYTKLASGGWRQTASVTTHDDKTGRPVQVADLGETGVSDNQCTRTEYADNADKHIYNLTSRVETLAVDCGTTPDRGKDVISDNLTYYDGSTTLGAAPAKGNPTTQKRLAEHSGTTATYETVSTSTYDDYGRPLKATDAAGTATTATYTDTNGLGTAKKETGPLGWTNTTEYAPEWGHPVVQIDQNGKRTDLAYDGLGRLVSVWLPDRKKASGMTPSLKYSYGVRGDGTSYVRTQRLTADGTTYGNEYALYDGMMRPRQVQGEGQDGKALIADTYYDGSGRVIKANDTYFADVAPSGKLFTPKNADIDAQTVTEYDGAGRTRATIFKVEGEEKHRTTYTYGGDRVHVDPPEGQTPTTTLTDARERTVELRQYKGASPQPSGPAADYVSTKYTHTPSGQLAKVTDADGNTWTYGYDQRGRKIRTEDPDVGVSTYGYDKLDRQISVTDSRKNTTTTEYDVVGRVKGTWNGPAGTGERLTVTTYDTVAKGQVYGRFAYKGGVLQNSVVNAELDEMYRPTRTQFTVPKAVEPELGDKYEFTTQYYADGTLQSQSYPAVGGLPAESVSYQYDEVQRPVALNTSLAGGTYVPEAVYSPTNQLEQLVLHTGRAADKKTWLTYAYERGTKRLNNASVRIEGADSGPAYDGTYTYDAAGNVQSVVDKPGSDMADAQCFTYDGLRRMTEAWTSRALTDGKAGTGAADMACKGGPTADTAGGTAPYWHSYGYDVTGNRTSVTRHAVGGQPESRATYTYGEGDAGPHHVTKVVTETDASETEPAVRSQDTYTYDATGNTTSRVIGGDTQKLTWNAQSKLATAEEADGSRTDYTYDDAGGRILRKTAGQTTLYLPGMELRLDTETKAVEGTRYYTFNNTVVASRDKNGLMFVAGDHHGTAEVAVNPATGDFQRRRLDPFGQARDERSAEVSAWPNERGFVGAVNDPSTGLLQMGARQYDPTTGRFLSADPIIDYTDPQQINGYAYGLNNPVTFSDPDGLAPDDCIHVGISCQYKGEKGGWTVKPTETYYTYYGVQKPKETPAQYTKRVNQDRANAAKQRAIAVAKELAQIAADELGITDALDCFTTGSLGSCGSTAVNIALSFASGLAGKLAVKYGLDFRNWDKAAALVRRIGELAGKLFDNVKQWIRCKNSFVPGTLVLMADGSTKPIEDVEIGDEVLATDPETGETTSQEVTAEIRGQGLKHLVRLTLDLDGEKGDHTASVTATDNHPFWVPELNEWLDATDLDKGNWLQTSAGTRVQIAAVERTTGLDATVHNLTVAGVHTYYVLAGATPVLVHNCNPLDGIADELAGSKVTTGQVVDDAGNKVGAPVSSGENGSFTQVRDALKKSGVPHDAAGGFAAASHVETKIALAMRSNGVQRATVVINNSDGVCSGPYSCMTGVSAILPRGSSLTSVWRTEEGWHGVTMLGGG